MLQLSAFAKINLGLRVLGKRSDGFHEICTVFQTVSLHDQLTFELRADDRIVLTCDAPDVPIDERNIVVKAANLLRARCEVTTGARIHLEKRIPSPGGLGGGSSDAAVTLLALAHLWRINISSLELFELGGRLGADVPFFFVGGTALGTGLGTDLTPLPDVPPTRLLIVTPNEVVPTGEAYQRLDVSPLTDQEIKVKLHICRAEIEDQDLLQSKLQNDFETTVFRWKPVVELVKVRLLEAGSKQALLSGSGASVFGIFADENAQIVAQERLSSESDWRVFAASTVSRREYVAGLQPCVEAFII